MGGQQHRDTINDCTITTFLLSALFKLRLELSHQSQMSLQLWRLSVVDRKLSTANQIHLEFEQDNNSNTISVRGEGLEMVEDFKYLGIYLKNRQDVRRTL